MKNILKRFLTLFLVLGSVFTFILLGKEVIAANSDLPSYYDSVDFTNLYGNSLKSELRTLITSTHKKITSYGDCADPDLVEKTDGDPNKPGNIILFWSGLSIDSAWTSGKTWNREHVWPQSQGWFGESGAGADMHHIRPTDASVNSSHGNNPYGIVSGGKYVGISSTNGGGTTTCKVGGSIFEPCDERKGDAARIIFYMLTRYSQSDNYSITNVATSMDLLLEWNASDPVDESEIRRNNAVYEIQGNRNPFIDDSNFANLIWDYDGSVVLGKGKVNVTYDSQHASVAINGNKGADGYYTGRVEINVTVNNNVLYSGIKDLSTNNMLTTSTTYVISNITKDFNLEVCTTYISGGSSGNQPNPDIPSIDGAKYTLITNVNELTLGTNVVVVASGSDYALSTTQKDNNRGQTSVVKSNDKSILTSVSDDIQVLTIVNGNKSGTYGLYTGSGYLCSASSTANYLRTESSLTNNSSWLITINSNGVVSVVSQGSYSRNIMRYNSGSSLFGCYSTGQQDISLYKVASGTGGNEGEEIDNSLVTFKESSTKSSLNIGYKVITQNGSGEVKKQFTLPPIGITSNTTVKADTNYASYFGLDENVFNVTFNKDSATMPALNPSDGFRLYSTSTSNGSYIEITTTTGLPFSALDVAMKSGYVKTLDIYVKTALNGSYTKFTSVSDSNNEVKFTENVYAIKVANFSGAQTRITGFSVTYGENTVQDVYNLTYTAVRYGTMIEASLYDALMAKGENVFFGVAAAKQASLEASGKTLSDFIGNSSYFFVCNPVRVNEQGEEDENGDYYQFALLLTNVPKTDLDVAVTAACYVSIDGEITMMQEVTRSVKDVASLYLAGDTSGITEHIGILKYINSYTKE